MKVTRIECSPITRHSDHSRCAPDCGSAARSLRAALPSTVPAAAPRRAYVIAGVTLLAYASVTAGLFVVHPLCAVLWVLVVSFAWVTR